MKKIICILLAVLCLGCFASCGGGKNDNSNIDLTTMSDTMIQTQLSNMSAFPSEFGGKTVKMQGFVAINETGEEVYCVYTDPTGCCTRVMVLDWPVGSDIPNASTTVTVEGTYDGAYAGVQKDYICGRLTNITVS